jgi:hypothetical protein
MTRARPLPRRRGIFRPDEPVIQSHPLLDGAISPRFGQTQVWDFNDVVRRPANRQRQAMRISFGGLSEVRNLLAREMAMIWLNPRHPAVLARDLHLRPTPHTVGTARARVWQLGNLFAWADTVGLPDDPADWAPQELHWYLAHLAGRGRQLGSCQEAVTVIKAIHHLGPALTCGGLRADPWPGKGSREVLALPVVEHLATRTIDPQVWFPLVRAAWAYINDFAPDILRARALVREPQGQDTAGADRRSHDTFLADWLADPEHRIPLHPAGTSQPGQVTPGQVNWRLLHAMTGAGASRGNLFSGRDGGGLRRRAIVEQVVAAGRTQYGLLPDPRQVHRPEGTIGPWHPCLDPWSLRTESIALRNACYVFVAAFSMMRDSEIREITKHSTVEHYGAPAVASTKVKRDPDLPVTHWWIIEPVAQAIAVACDLAPPDAELAFTGLHDAVDGEGFDSREAVARFIRHVNRHRHATGLAHIPESHVTPHMFRRTMAMLTSDFPGSEIALGMQLKHVAARALANRWTQGYAEKTPVWARYFDQAVEAARFNKLRELYQAHGRGEPIGYGPAAERLAKTFDAVALAADQMRANGRARHGDARVEHDLLRHTRVSLRFGKLNHCALDETNPVGAKCLEDAVVPGGHRGPLIDRCQPGRCANSIITREHVVHHKAYHARLVHLLTDRKLPPGRRAALQEQLADVREVIKKVEP